MDDQFYCLGALVAFGVASALHRGASAWHLWGFSYVDWLAEIEQENNQ